MREMTVAVLAERAGISHTYLSRIEGSKRGLSLPLAERLAKALEVSVSQLLGLEESNSFVGIAEANIVTADDVKPMRATPSEIVPFVERKSMQVERWQVLSPAVDRLGIKPGSIVFVDVSDNAIGNLKDLDIVVLSWFHGDVERYLLRMHIKPGLFITNSSDRQAVPLEAERDQIFVKGKVFGEYRSITGASATA